MTMGGISDNQAAGRVFCTYTGGFEYMVWTQNDNHLMGSVAGRVHGDVWTWWVAIHHNIGVGGAPDEHGRQPVPRHRRHVLARGQHVPARVPLRLDEHHGRMTARPRAPGSEARLPGELSRAGRTGTRT